jgi:hypothetical protein
MIMEGFAIISVVGGVVAALGMIILWFLLRRDERQARSRRMQPFLDPMGDVSQLP